MPVKDTSFNVGSRYVARNVKIDPNELPLHISDVHMSSVCAHTCMSNVHQTRYGILIITNY